MCPARQETQQRGRARRKESKTAAAAQSRPRHGAPTSFGVCSSCLEPRPISSIFPVLPPDAKRGACVADAVPAESWYFGFVATAERVSCRGWRMGSSLGEELVEERRRRAEGDGGARAGMTPSNFFWGIWARPLETPQTSSGRGTGWPITISYLTAPLSACSNQAGEEGFHHSWVQRRDRPPTRQARGLKRSFFSFKASGSTEILFSGGISP